MKPFLLIACILAAGLFVGCDKGSGTNPPAATAPTKTAADHQAEAKKEITADNAEDELKKLEAELNAPDPTIE